MAEKDAAAEALIANQRASFTGPKVVVVDRELREQMYQEARRYRFTITNGLDGPPIMRRPEPHAPPTTLPPTKSPKSQQ